MPLRDPRVYRPLNSQSASNLTFSEKQQQFPLSAHLCSATAKFAGPLHRLCARVCVCVCLCVYVCVRVCVRAFVGNFCDIIAHVKYCMHERLVALLLVVATCPPFQLCKLMQYYTHSSCYLRQKRHNWGPNIHWKGARVPRDNSPSTHPINL